MKRYTYSATLGAARNTQAVRAVVGARTSRDDRADARAANDAPALVRVVLADVKENRPVDSDIARVHADNGPVTGAAGVQRELGRLGRSTSRKVELRARAAAGLKSHVRVDSGVGSADAQVGVEELELDDRAGVDTEKDVSKGTTQNSRSRPT